MIGTINWQSIRPVSAVGYENAYLDLPAFTYAAPWNGASEIICQFNYAASSNFVLQSLPTMPTGANYVLAIRYRVGSEVYRWKLWGDIGEVMPNVDLYDPTANVIKKNFVLEVWNIAGSATVSQDAAMRLFTSVRRAPSNILSIGDYPLATGTLVYPLSVSRTPVAAPPTTGIQAWYKASKFLLGTWTDDSGNGYDLLFSGGPYQDSADFGGRTITTVKFADVSHTISGAYPSSISHLLMAFRPSGWTIGRMVFDGYTIAPRDAFYLQQSVGTPTIQFMSKALAFPLDTGHILRASAANAATDGLYRYDTTGVLQANSVLSAIALPTPANNIVFGDALMDIAEVLAYNATISEAELAQAIAYLADSIEPVIPLPMTFADGAEGGDNA